jgi:hypothetical protein
VGDSGDINVSLVFGEKRPMKALAAGRRVGRVRG